jgi:hypothetical protein
MTVATILDLADTAGAIVWGVLIFFTYFGPTFVGWRKPNAFTIFVMNLFLGWTLVGWIVALVWALRADPPAKRAISPPQIAPAIATSPAQPVQQNSSQPAQEVCSSPRATHAVGRAVRWLKTPISFHP